MTLLDSSIEVGKQSAFEVWFTSDRTHLKTLENRLARVPEQNPSTKVFSGACKARISRSTAWPEGSGSKVRRIGHVQH